MHRGWLEHWMVKLQEAERDIKDQRTEGDEKRTRSHARSEEGAGRWVWALKQKLGRCSYWG